MASSTTKPSASVSASRLTLSSEKPIIDITPNVPAIDSGNAMAGMMVARQVRRKARITSTTRAAVSTSVTCTSCTASRIVSERSDRMLILIVGGISRSNCGISALMLSATSTVLASGWRWMLSTIERLPLNSAQASSFSTESSTLAMSSRRTGAPLRQATTTFLK